jgi:uncharacterized protein YneR
MSPYETGISKKIREMIHTDTPYFLNFLCRRYEKLGKTSGLLYIGIEKRTGMRVEHMAFSVSKEAAEWFKEELGVGQGDYVRFFIKLYGGIPTAHPDYYLGVTVGKEGEPAIKDVVDGITFYFNADDAWFLNEYQLKVVMGSDEVEYIFDSAK